MFVVRSRHQPRQQQHMWMASKFMTHPQNISVWNWITSANGEHNMKLKRSPDTFGVLWNMKWGRLSIVIMHGEERRLVDDEEYIHKFFSYSKAEKKYQPEWGSFELFDIIIIIIISISTQHWQIATLHLLVQPIGLQSAIYLHSAPIFRFFCAAKPFATRVPWKSQMMTSCDFAFLLLNLKLTVSYEHHGWSTKKSRYYLRIWNWKWIVGTLATRSRTRQILRTPSQTSCVPTDLA